MPLDDVMVRRATFSPNTFNADAMTVEAVISTFAPVTRRDRAGSFEERLSASGLDTSALIGAPVLDGHRQGSARDVIGTVSAFRMEGNALLATIRLSGAPDAAPIVHRISEGTIKGVSIGYRVSRWENSTDPQTKARVRTAAAWAITEVSAVPIPADAGATFRSQEMANDDETLERDDRADLIHRVRSAHNLPEEWQTRMEDAGDEITDDEIRADGRRTAQDRNQTRSRETPRIRTANPNCLDDPTAVMNRRADALFARTAGAAPSEEARPYMNESLRDMARAAVELTGQSTRMMDDDQLFRAAMHTTSDFPNLLTSTGNRVLMASYQNAASPVKSVLARQSTLADFRPGTKLRLSDGGLLQEVSESGEITHTTRGESSEVYALKTYASQFAISRKALINDDLGAFRDWGQTAGRMAAETENNLLMGLLLGNPTMGEDGTALFHADHSNLAASGTSLGSASDISALGEGRKSMRNRKGLDGSTPINATPKFLLVGPETETAAEAVLSTIYAATYEDANPFSGRLTLLVEPRIRDGRWYLFADPATLPVLEYAYLAGAQGPQMSSREGWGVQGMEFRVVLDFGCGAIDWRGAYLNEGD